VWLPHALLAAGWIDLRRTHRETAARRAADALQLGQKHNDRPAVAEALLLQAAIRQPPSADLAEESRRLWRDLGNPIGEARAMFVLAETTAGAARTELVATAERLLFVAGAFGALADARRATTAMDAGTPAIVISTLGGFRVSRNGAPVEVSDWGSRKARDLVKLLVARRGAPVVRDEVATMLWPDETDRSARRLSVLLSTIRSVFDPAKTFPPDHYVGADHDTMWLVREHVDVDVELFLREAAEGRRLLATGAVEKGAGLLAQAAARYLGDFCADDPYADWAAGLRELARHTFVEAAGQLGHRLRVLDVDPYDETAHLELIRALNAQRRHGEARRAYRTYCTRLSELDLDPVAFPA
jgi:DNA-binding SARP family transcriptional activator